MFFLRNLRLRWKLLIAPSLTILFMLGLSFIGFQSLQGQQKIMASIVEVGLKKEAETLNRVVDAFISRIRSA